MTFTIAKSLGTTLVLIGALSGCRADQAPASDTAATPAPTAMPAPEAMPATPPAPEADTAATAIPDTADGIWQAIDTHRSELKAVIDSGALTTVHHHAFAIRDLVVALPAHSPSLSAEDLAKLEGEVKFVTTLADRLDESGDAGDKAASQTNYDKLVAVLDGITRYK